jgi:hypothetical protein
VHSIVAPVVAACTAAAEAGAVSQREWAAIPILAVVADAAAFPQLISVPDTGSSRGGRLGARLGKALLLGRVLAIHRTGAGVESRA